MKEIPPSFYDKNIIMRLLVVFSATLVAVFTCSPFAFAQDKNGYYGLNHILKRVYVQNPTLMAARAELRETEEVMPQAKAGWLPSVNAEASVFATDVDTTNFGSGDGATTKDLTLSLDQPIWRGGQTFAEVERAKDVITVGEAVLRQAEQDIFEETVRVYMDLMRDRELLELRVKNEEMLAQELLAARERLEIGEATETDVQQAKSRLFRVKSLTIDAENQRDISHAAFVAVVGGAAPSNMLVPYLDFKLPDTLDALLKLANEQNPNLIIARFQHEASKHDVDRVFRELLPQVSAFASFNRQYDPQPGIVDKTSVETIGVRATIALYQGGATRSREREARYASKRREFEIEETKRSVRREVIENWGSYRAALQQTENRKQEIEASEAALKGVRMELDVGQRTLLDLLDADEEVIEAKVGLSFARRNEIVALFSLANSLGLLTVQSLGIADHLREWTPPQDFE